MVVYIQPEYTKLSDNELNEDLIPFVTLRHIFSVLENEDIVDDENIKYKSLQLVDKSLELFREKNIDFSTANLVTDKPNITDVDDDDRAVLTGDALKAIIRMGYSSLLSILLEYRR